MSELKPCPFCGSEVQDDERGEKYPKKSPMGGWIIHCECCGASLSQFRKSGKGEISWNTRPIEYALNARITELEAAQRWHVVDDGDLPIVGKSIMFYDSSSEEIYRGVYTASHHWRANYFSEKCGTVTHWMPLPKLPEVQE